jgi:bifunctional non-homologous end joining protein LigD
MRYRSGRNDAWLKSKCINEREFVVGGYKRQPTHPVRLAALLIGAFEKKQLTFAGWVGTGFDRKESARLLKNALEQKTPAFARGPMELASSYLDLANADGAAQFHRVDTTMCCAILPIRDCEDKPAVTRETCKRLVAGQLAKNTMSQANKPKSPDKPNVIAGVSLTHPDKVLYPEQKSSKQDLAKYY